MSRYEQMTKAQLIEDLQELQESEGAHRDLLETLPVAVVVHAADTSILSCNRLARELLGLAEDEATGRIAEDPRWVFYREDGSEMPVEEFPVVQVVNTLKPLRGHVVGVANPDSGEVTWVLVDAIPKLDEENALRTVLVTFRDITVRKRVEEALEQVNERLMLATTAGGVGIWELDVVTNNLTWDDQMFRLYGITPDNFGGAYETWKEGVHPEDIERSDAEVQMALRGEREFDTEFRVVWPDGAIRHIAARAQVHRNAVGQPTKLIGTNYDITERKRVEEELEKLIVQLREALEQVKTLRGIVPICSHCKKIRNDEGYWQQVEVYVRDHTEAEFSHSICVECMKDVYPEEAAELLGEAMDNKAEE